MRVLRDRLARDESGSTLLLTIGCCVLGLAVIVVTIGATSLYLERKRLFTIADGAALAGAEAFVLADVRREGDRLVVELDPDDVSAAVAEHLAASVGARDEVRVLRATSTDGRSATVTLGTTWRAPILGEWLPAEVPIDVTSVARSVFSG
ncbi:pilus assembly protein TadG-related protein [Agromyces chitinivorans]|uniref:pilus assembly protein TadG-related protein n=1 Tax=Agromyces chitinivorans TaxID=3158560 RepID=UPI003F51727C